MSVRLDHGADDLAEIHEINVTPFIDVILVLLIIFMIAAPLATVDVAVDLPAANAQQRPRPDRPIFLTLKSDLSLAIGDQPVMRAGLERSRQRQPDHHHRARAACAGAARPAERHRAWAASDRPRAGGARRG